MYYYKHDSNERNSEQYLHSVVAHFCFLFQNEANFSDYTQNVVLQSSPQCVNCSCSDALGFQILLDSSWDNAALRCITHNGTHTVSESASQTITLLPPRKLSSAKRIIFINRKQMM